MNPFMVLYLNGEICKENIMYLLLARIKRLLLRSKVDLNRIASTIYSGDISPEEAVQIYGLKVKELEFVAETVKMLRESTNYINQTLS